MIFVTFIYRNSCFVLLNESEPCVLRTNSLDVSRADLLPVEGALVQDSQ